uniref:SHC adaptor protein 2 n=1 Tax=Aquila chrysaetos chrysaetos TaxID=223781 RepID=A0A663DWC2_AQUCH
MLPEPKYDRFRDEPLTAPMPSPAPAPCPAAGEEPEPGTTFCALLPRMPQWKFPGPAGFLGRGPAGAGAGRELSAPARAGGTAAAGAPSALAAVLGACEPLCAAPCSLPAGGRPRGAAGRAARAEAARPGGEEWSRKGSFIRKPAQGWLHPDERVLGPGVSYIVRYMGCIEVLRSMRSLDFNTRTQVTREAINRLYEAVPGVKGIWKKKVSFHPASLFSILGKSNLRFAGMSIAVNISVDGLNLMIPTTRQIIANHHMQSISFASGGDTDTTDYVAYVAKDPINQRACHILECCEGLAQSVISTVGQAFELRFKQYLHSPPKVVVPPDRALGAEESAWGEDEEVAEHDYYNSIPGKEPPPGGLIDSRLRHGTILGHVRTQPSGSGPPQPGEPLGPLPVLLWGSQLHECIAGGGTSPPIEDQWPSPPTRKAPIAPTEEQLRREPWYHGKMSRRDAERLLQMDGDFLVRDSLTNPGQYVLTGMHSGQPKHLLLVDPEGVVRAGCGMGNGGRGVRAGWRGMLEDTGCRGGQASGVAWGTCAGGSSPGFRTAVPPGPQVRTKDVLFESISHLISHHRQNEQPIVAAESELHLRQVVRRKQ